MNRKVTLVVPEAPAPALGALAAQRKIEKRGVRLGVLDNSKGNADHLLAMVVEGVRAALPIASVVSLRKDVVSLPAPTAILDRLPPGGAFASHRVGDRG